MNDISEIIESYYGIHLDNNALGHIGVKYRSGRYPYGSGEVPYQHDPDFLGKIDRLKKEGWKEDAEGIRKEFNMSLNEYRIQKSLAKDDQRYRRMQRAKILANEEKLGPTEIARKLSEEEKTDISEALIRTWLKKDTPSKMDEAYELAEFMKQQVDKNRMVDVGKGVEHEFNISREKMNTALEILKREGYLVEGARVPQITNPSGQQTSMQVLCAPDVQKKELYDYDKIHALNEDNYTSNDGGKTFTKFQYPASLDSSRLAIRYSEDGGTERDGIVEIRPGVPDLSLGNDRYSQVRILVDGDKYIKGMAVYSNNLPEGVDILVNSNKSREQGIEKALKPVFETDENGNKRYKSGDPSNPFGALIKANGQSYYDDPNGEYTNPITGKKQSLSLINKRAEQGDWEDWKNSLPSQFLAKQQKDLIKKQIDLALAEKNAELGDIRALTNPTVKKYYLNKFAESCDKAAETLSAAALPGQQYHVLIPINTLKDNEVYAPNYPDGSKLALVRYPHGGTFEIPILTVNNKNKLGNEILGKTSPDAVGINHKNAERLSGADFDGDTVMCIPTHDPAGKIHISSRDQLKGLIGFEPKEQYPERPGMRYMTNTQNEMGRISNLITDMTIRGANDDELARAVRHSMVVIDAEKHKLDYTKSYVDNDIESLKKIYQVKERDADGNVTKYGGAGTILSRAKGEESEIRTQGSPKINLQGKYYYDPTKPEGALLYKQAYDAVYPNRTSDKEARTTTYKTEDNKKIVVSWDDKKAMDYYKPVKVVGEDGKTTIGYTNSDGTINYKLKDKLQKTTRMAAATDAYELVSEQRGPVERMYANYANSLKSMANESRKEMVLTKETALSKEAQKEYANEVASLKSKLNNAYLNKPKERQAQRLANAELNKMMKDNPTIKGEKKRKIAQQSIEKWRNALGSKKRTDRNIEITAREWEAIQKGAVPSTTLKQILNNSNPDTLRSYSMPKNSNTLSASKQAMIKNLVNSNYTTSQIAERLGISASTVKKYME